MAWICEWMDGKGSMARPRTAVTSACALTGTEVVENAFCTVVEAVDGVNVPRRRKIADGFSLESLQGPI